MTEGRPIDRSIPLLAPRRIGLAAAVVLLALAVVFGIRFVGDVETGVRHSGGGTALSDYLESGRLVVEGDLYGINYSYPPVFAVAMVPFTWLPQRGAAALWWLLQVGALVGVGVLAMRALRDCGTKARWVVLVVAFAFCFRFLNNNLIKGNVNTFVLLLAMGASLATWRGRDGRAGFGFAAAATVKFLPLFFAPVLLLSGRVKACIAMLVALVVLNAAVPAVALGPARALETSRGWYEKMIAPFVGKSVASMDERNLGLGAVVQRHFQEDPSNTLDAQTRFRADWIAPSRMNLVSKAIQGSVGLAVLLAVWRGRRDRSARRALLELALVLATLLLVSPKTWKAHYAWLLPAFLFLADELIARWRDPSTGARVRRWVFVGLALVGSLSSRGVVGRRASDVLDELSLPTIMALGLWLLLLARALDPRAPSDADAGTATPVLASS